MRYHDAFLPAALAALALACGTNTSSPRPASDRDAADPRVRGGPFDLPPSIPGGAPAGSSATSDSLDLVEISGERAIFRRFDLARAAAPGSSLVPVATQDLALLPPNQANWPRLVAARDRDHLFAATADNGVHRIVELYPAASDARGAVMGASRPTALLAVGRSVVVGAGAEVGWISFAERPLPQYRVVHTRALGSWKAYDLLVREGDRIFAVDDIMMPFYGDTFSITPSGLVHRVGFELPPQVNGRYTSAAALGGPAPLLLLGAGYSVMSGFGNTVQALPIEPATGRVVWNGMRTPPPPTVAEFAPRDTGSPEPTNLVGGDAFTDWTSIAIASRSASPRVVVAAGARGVVTAPLPFGSPQRAALVDVGGACLDLVEQGDSVWALVQSTNGTRLTRLRPSGESVAPEVWFGLPGSPTVIVR